MTFKIEQEYGQWARDSHRAYGEGEQIKCEVAGGFLGLVPKDATVISLASGKGFGVRYDDGGGRFYDKGQTCWSNLGEITGT